MRAVLAVIASIVITFGLFYFMATLVTSSKFVPKIQDNENFIDFVRLKPKDDLDVRKRELPKKPPPPKSPPKVPKVNVAQNEPLNRAMPKMDVPKLDMSPDLKGGLFLGNAGPGGSQDSEVLPLVRIEPRYPRKAAMAGIEGNVTLQFDISETGTVQNVQVLGAEPKRTFDKAASQALLKWRYKPKMVDGKPVIQKSLKVNLEFKLEN